MKKAPRDPRTDGVVRAQLDGKAGYAAHHRLPLEEAVASILAVAPDRPRLLHEVAGTALGAWEADPVTHWLGCMKADLLVAAGADPWLMEPYRAAAFARLSVSEGPRFPTF